MSVMRKLKRKSHSREYKVEPLQQDGTFVGRKMSEVILDFAEPLLIAVDEDDEEQFKAAIEFSIICWNLSFLPEQEQQEQLRLIVDELGGTEPRARLETEEFTRILLGYKKAFFAGDKRMVVNYSIIEEKDRRRLLVASVLAKD